MATILIFIIFSLKLSAPGQQFLYIARAEPVNLYERIWQAVCQVESSNNPLAYNPREDAYGIAQIRQIRLTEYNNLSGKDYKIHEMYDPAKSKEIFIFYAARIKEPDMIIRRWNGSGAQTYKYLEKVKKSL